MPKTDRSAVHFLLVDDREENLLSLEGLLRREGLVLLKATSGVEALELLLEHEVALAILDVQMPGMDGFELAELMRGSERTRTVPIIFLTAGSADRQRRFRGYEAGAVDFLHKPIEPDILRSKTDVFFELFRQRQQLADQRDALELADKRKDEFLAVLAHELRNPLTPIRYGLDIMRMFPDRPVAPEVQAMMDRQLSHLVRLIDDLMDVSRISRGKIELRKARVPLQTALKAALEACRPLIESKNHTLVVNVPERPLWLNADATRLSQVMSNLLNNAAKYTPDGGRIELSAHEEGNGVVVSISDTGIGIPQEMLTRVFDLFTQVGKHHSNSGGGLGIGLALARQLAEMHEGSIHVSSPGSGMGTTFTVRLPLDGEARTGPNESLRTSADPGSLRILVVDDDRASAEATAQILEMVGHAVTLAHDGASALTAAREIRPDAIVLDIGMPGMTGYEVSRKLRDDPLFKETILIAQTGWGHEIDRTRSREAGFDHHLTKPVKFEELSQLLAGGASVDSSES